MNVNHIDFDVVKVRVPYRPKYYLARLVFLALRKDAVLKRRCKTATEARLYAARFVARFERLTHVSAETVS